MIMELFYMPVFPAGLFPPRHIHKQRVLAELLLKYTLICACFLCFSLAARGRASVMSLPLDNARKCLLSKRADRNTHLPLPIAGAVSLFTIVPVKRIGLKKSYIFLQKDI